MKGRGQSHADDVLLPGELDVILAAVQLRCLLQSAALNQAEAPDEKHTQ